MDRAATDLWQSHSKPNTEPSSAQIGLSILSLTFVPSILHSSRRPKPPTPTFPLPPPNTQRGEWCLLYLAPLPSLWGRTHFDRPVFMAGWSHVGMNHEKDQNHLAGCSFMLSVGQLCGSVCVAYVKRMGLVWVYEWMCGSRIKISPLMSNECVDHSVFIICRCLHGRKHYMFLFAETVLLVTINPFHAGREEIISSCHSGVKDWGHNPQNCVLKFNQSIQDFKFRIYLLWHFVPSFLAELWWRDSNTKREFYTKITKNTHLNWLMLASAELQNVFLLRRTTQSFPLESR